MTVQGLPCIVCDSPETRVRDDGYPWQVNEGLICTTTGNYGSTLFDPVTGTVRLFFVICDDCMKAKHEAVMVLTEARNVVAVAPDSTIKAPSFVGFEKLHREAVEWNPEIDYEEEDLQVDWEDIGSEEYKHIDWRVTP